MNWQYSKNSLFYFSQQEWEMHDLILFSQMYPKRVKFHPVNKNEYRSKHMHGYSIQ